MHRTKGHGRGCPCLLAGMRGGVLFYGLHFRTFLRCTLLGPAFLHTLFGACFCRAFFGAPYKKSVALYQGFGGGQGVCVCRSLSPTTACCCQNVFLSCKQLKKHVRLFFKYILAYNPSFFRQLMFNLQQGGTLLYQLKMLIFESNN